MLTSLRKHERAAACVHDLFRGALRHTALLKHVGQQASWLAAVVEALHQRLRSDAFLACALLRCVLREQDKAILAHGQEYCHAVAWSPDSQCVASCGNDAAVVRVWDAATGEALAALDCGHTRWILSLAWSPNGRYLASVSASGAGTVTVYSPHTKAVIWSAQHRNRAWDDVTGAYVYVDEALGDVPLYAVAWSCDGARLASASQDGTIELWNAATGAPLGCLAPYHNDCGPVYGVAWSPRDALMLASVHDNGDVQLWNTTTAAAPGNCVIFSHSRDAANVHRAAVALAWSPCGSLLASAPQDAALVVVCDVDAPVSRRLLALKDNASFPADVGTTIAWSPDGTLLVSAHSFYEADNDGTVANLHVWPWPGEGSGDTSQSRCFHRHPRDVFALAWSPCAAWLAAATADGKVLLLKMK